MLYLIGKSEKLHYLTNVSIRGAKGEPLCLAFKTSILYFGLPLGLFRDGYVLGIILKEEGDKVHFAKKQYYNLTDADVKKYQNAGLLPDPLPLFTTPLGDRVAGFWAWGLFGIGGLLSLLGS